MKRQYPLLDNGHVNLHPFCRSRLIRSRSLLTSINPSVACKTFALKVVCSNLIEMLVQRGEARDARIEAGRKREEAATRREEVGSYPETVLVDFCNFLWFSQICLVFILKLFCFLSWNLFGFYSDFFWFFILKLFHKKVQVKTGKGKTRYDLWKVKAIEMQESFCWNLSKRDREHG